MSAEVRQAIADAANTVEGITAKPYYWQTTEPGSAMVRVDRITYPNKFGGVRTWQVWVVLPNDLATAEQRIDEQVPALVAALSSELAVTSVTPSILAIGSGVPGVVIEGTREEEA